MDSFFSCLPSKMGFMSYVTAANGYFCAREEGKYALIELLIFSLNLRSSVWNLLKRKRRSTYYCTLLPRENIYLFCVFQLSLPVSIGPDFDGWMGLCLEEPIFSP